MATKRGKKRDKSLYEGQHLKNENTTHSELQSLESKSLQRIRRSRRRATITLIGMVLWVFFYGALVLIEGWTPTIPDRVYLYSMKIISITLALVIYVRYVATATKVIRGMRDIIDISIMSLSLIMIVIFSYADIYKFLGIVDSKGIETQNPVTCLYFSIVTYTTVGYGDFTPKPEARLFAASEALVGYILLGVFVGVLLQSLFKLQEAKK